MAVYSKLLLSTGGGIISAKQQAKQAENTASILIGLGGTGIDCIKTIKAAVRERLEPDDPKSVVAEYKHIQFMGVDTDKKSFTKKQEEGKNEVHSARDLKVLDDTEVFDISNAAIANALKNPRAIEMRPELQWLNYKELDIPDLADHGAGGFRQIGRYMLMDKSNKFMDDVGTLIRTAKSGLTNPTVNIHIFSGLSGGTGSGTFLDVCYMVKEVAALNGGATISGYFFLPDVNLDKIPTDNRLTRVFIPCNAYAAMQELDYCMRISENGGAFIQNYKGGRQIKWEEPPVTMCHLIGGIDANHNVSLNVYNYAINVASEYVMDFLTRPNDPDCFALHDHLARIKANMEAAKHNCRIGANLNYCILGASCASVPMREINTYLASKIFGKFKGILENEPTEQGVQEFASKAELNDYDMLRRELSEGAGDDYSVFGGTWKEVRDFGDQELVKHYTDQTAAKKGKIETNAKSMMTETNSHSLIGRMRQAMIPYITSIQYGPVYAYGMLEAARSHNLLNIVDGLIEENMNRWNQEKFQDRYGEYEYARDTFKRKPNKRTYAEYEWRIECLEKQKREIALFGQMDTVLKKFREQVVQVTTEYYLVLQRVTRNLLDTFEENHAALVTGKGIMKTNDFAEPLMTIEELRPKLDAAIEKISVDGIMSQLMGVLIQQEEQWKQEDENKIAKLVNDFFVNVAFSDFASKSITSFLKDKYNTTVDDVIKNNVYEQYMKPLAEKAQPLFAFNPSVWDNSLTGKIGFVSIPTSAKPVVDAAKKLMHNNLLFAVKESALTDRIYLMVTACALPLGSYAKCSEYEKVYFATDRIGGHYYEGMEEGYFNDWRQLPSLVPESRIDYNQIPLKLKEQLEAGKELYQIAIDANLLEEDKVCSLEEASRQKLETAMVQAEKAMEAVKTGNPAAKQILAKAQAELAQALADIQTVPTGYVLPHCSVADAATIDRVRRDFFLISPAIQEMMRADIAVIDKAKAVQEQLKETAAIGNQKEQIITDFCYALCSGIFDFKPLQITYHKEEFGISSDVILSKMGPEFPFMKVPLYQAFVSFKAMEEDEKKNIVQEANNLINNMDPRVIEILTDLKAKLNPQYNAIMAQNAGAYAEAEEIIAFLKKVSRELNSLAGMFGIF